MYIIRISRKIKEIVNSDCYLLKWIEALDVSIKVTISQCSLYCFLFLTTYVALFNFKKLAYGLGGVIAQLKYFKEKL